MSHCRLLAFVLLMIAAPSGRADDPPDRLEKKPAPTEPKRSGAPPKPDEKPARDDEDQPKTDPAADAAKLREKIAEDMQAAEKKLKDRDSGPDTQQAQDRALRNIDKLIDLANNPPPPPPQQPPMGGSPPPMGGDQQQQGGQPQSRPQSGQSRREQREQRRQQARGKQPRPQTQTQSAGAQKGGEQLGNNVGQPGSGGMKAAGQPEQITDVVKDIWGHLPETLRQEMDHYYRDRFMPRYRDLLQEYYSRIAERDRTRRGDR